MNRSHQAELTGEGSVVVIFRDVSLFLRVVQAHLYDLKQRSSFC